MEKIIKGLTPLRIPKLSKKAQDTEDEKSYMKLVGIGMIVNYNYIGTSLSGSTQGFISKEKNSFSFLKKK